MADGIVWNLAAKALELLGKEAVRKAASWWGARVDLEKLQNTIKIIQAGVGDAERRQEGENSELIKLWLQRLRLVLYRADDLFDEVLTLDLLKQQQRVEKSMLCKVGILFTKSGPLCYNRQLANEIKSIREQLDAIKSDMAGLNLSVLPAQELPMARLMENRETTSFVIQEDVTGRENDQNNIIEMLLDPKKDREQMTVISIVGFGGLGKTTLAQLVFNDERVKKHFELTRWSYVPEKDNKIVMMRKVYRSLTDKKYDNLSLEQIQQGIRESIENKKYLLVLDDLWDEGDDIKELLNLLKGGKHGSKVIVTTRSDLVAKHFGPNQVAYKLGTLNNDQSWELFKKLAFGPGQDDNNPALSNIGEQIVKMCKNVPLVIKTVGGSLCSKDTQEDWSRVKDDLSKAQLAESHTIMATLKLSYDYLQPVSKLCFAYCSLFPKGYEFEKDDLVHLWMAQGYVQLDKGDQYFWDLVARNLIQGPKISYKGDVAKYKMHDLLHDLAKEVAGEESMMLGYDPPSQISDRLVHINLNGSTCPPSLKDVNRLRSLFHITCNANDKKIFSEFQSLRVLSVEHSGEYKKLPNSIGKLIHLRYLNLEKTEIEYLPNSITRLVNLHTLNLRSCIRLKELPRDFAKLVNLRHLLLPRRLTDLPPGFGKLTSLQELNRFIVRKGNGIDSLGAWNLRGNLTIEFLRWRRDAIEEVKRANLKNNHQLTSLTLHLYFQEEESTAAVGDINEMLKCLQLPPNLKHLLVWNYKGDVMPVRWLEDEDNIRVGTATQNRCFFRSLEVLKLYRCSKLKGWTRASKDDGERRQLVFPCLSTMNVSACPMLMSMHLAPKLESLDVSDINWKLVESNLRSNDDEEAPSSSSAPPSSSTLFTSLKELHIREVNDELVSLSISSSLCNLSILQIFGCSQLRNLRFESPNSIQKIVIDGCKRLRNISEGLQHLSVLEELEINNCEELETEEEEQQEKGMSIRVWQGLSSLRELKLKTIPKVKTLPQGIACVTTLQELLIWGMENLTEIPHEIGNLSQLRQLRIENCPKLKLLLPSILGLAELQELYLENMDNLTELPDQIGNDNLPLLRWLHVIDCPKMKSFPTSIQGLPSLQRLYIWDCPVLAKRLMPNGEDCHLIQHIPNVYISDNTSCYVRKDGEEI